MHDAPAPGQGRRTDTLALPFPQQPTHGTAAVLALSCIAVLLLAACDSSPSAETQGKTIEVVSAVPDTTLSALDDTLFVDLRPYFSQVNGDSIFFRLAHSGADFIDVSVEESTGRLAAVAHDVGGSATVQLVAFDKARTYLQLSFRVNGPNLCPPDPLLAEDSFFPLGPGYAVEFDSIESWYDSAPYLKRERGWVRWEFDSVNDCLDSRSRSYWIRQTRAFVEEHRRSGEWVAAGDSIRWDALFEARFFTNEVLFNLLWFETSPLRWRFPDVATDSATASVVVSEPSYLERTTLRATFVRGVGPIEIFWFHFMHRDDHRVTLTRRN